MNRQLLTLPMAALLAISSPAVAQPVPPGPAAAVPAPAMDSAARQRIIDRAIANLTKSYVFPDKVPGIARALRKGLAGKYRTLADPQAFADAVNADIEAVANDRHLRLMWSSEGLPPMMGPSPADPAMRQRITTFMARRNFAIRNAQVLDGNVGYLKINGFLPAEDAGATLSAAMAFLKNSEALIVDLRDNGGGDPGGVAMLVSYLVPAETLIDAFHQRGKPVAEQIWSLPYVPGGRWSLDKPVYVLTGKKTASAAEEFAYDLQQLKRGTVVGEGTWGGANPGEMVAIDDHFAMFVPSGAAINPISKTNWEGVGIKPDVAVKSADALDVAHRLALQKLIVGATGGRRAELQEFLDAPAGGVAKPSIRP